MEPAVDAIPFRCHESMNLALMTFSGMTVHRAPKAVAESIDHTGRAHLWQFGGVRHGSLAFRPEAVERYLERNRV
jgi:hypothetical protein